MKLHAWLSTRTTRSAAHPPRRTRRRKFAIELLEDRRLLSLSFGLAFGAGSTNTDTGTAVATDTVGNIYVAGRFQYTVDFDPSPGTVSLTSIWSLNDPYDGFVAKYSPIGELTWVTQFEKSSEDIVLSGSNVYVVVTKGYGASADHSGQVVKLDATTGAVVPWGASSTLPGRATDVAVDPLGFVYVAGNTGPVSSYGERGAYVAKLDVIGDVLWSKATSVAGNVGAHAVDIAVDSSGNAYVTGSYFGTVDFDTGAGTFNLTSTPAAKNANGTYEDIFVWKLDSDGAYVWAGSMGGNGNERGSAIALDSAGDIYITGRFGGGQTGTQNDFDPGSGTLTLSIIGGWDIYVEKFTANPIDGGRSLTTVWAKSLGGRDTEIANALALDAAGSAYLTGYFYGTADFDPSTSKFNLTSAGSPDIFVCQLRTMDGSFVAAARMGGTGTDWGSGIAVDAAGNIFTTGQFGGLGATADFDPGSGTYNLTSQGNVDIFVSKLTQPSTSSALKAANFISATTSGAGSGTAAGQRDTIAAPASSQTDAIDFAIGQLLDHSVRSEPGRTFEFDRTERSQLRIQPMPTYRLVEFPTQQTKQLASSENRGSSSGKRLARSTDDIFSTWSSAELEEFGGVKSVVQ